MPRGPGVTTAEHEQRNGDEQHEQPKHRRGVFHHCLEPLAGNGAEHHQREGDGALDEQRGPGRAAPWIPPRQRRQHPHVPPERVVRAGAGENRRVRGCER